MTKYPAILTDSLNGKRPFLSRSSVILFGERLHTVTRFGCRILRSRMQGYCGPTSIHARTWISFFEPLAVSAQTWPKRIVGEPAQSVLGTTTTREPPRARRRTGIQGKDGVRRRCRGAAACCARAHHPHPQRRHSARARRRLALARTTARGCQMAQARRVIAAACSKRQ